MGDFAVTKFDQGAAVLPPKKKHDPAYCTD
jgi:hypothetical protein